MDYISVDRECGLSSPKFNNKLTYVYMYLNVPTHLITNENENYSVFYYI